MTRSTQDVRRVLLVQARNLGDAVISTAMVETVAYALPEARIDVLTRPEVARIFNTNPHIQQVHTARFPMGSMRDFSWRDLLALSNTIARLRRNRYTDVLNLNGDFREELLGRLITSQENWSPAWAKHHPCSRVVRSSWVTLANQPVPIPCSKPNIYDAAGMVASAVSGGPAQRSALYTQRGQKIVWNSGGAVGIHPMASQPWRCWPMEKWVLVAETLLNRGLEVVLFGAPAERASLFSTFAHLSTQKLRIVTGTLEQYFQNIAQVSVVLCPDSFAAHVAYAIGVPVILLNGANDARAWPPPDTAVLAAGPELPCYPCFNRPTCQGSSHEYACVRRIPHDAVLTAVWISLQRAGIVVSASDLRSASAVVCGSSVQ